MNTLQHSLVQLVQVTLCNIYFCVPLSVYCRVAASKRDVGLYLPLIVPAGFGFIGSFGGITRFKVLPVITRYSASNASAGQTPGQ